MHSFGIFYFCFLFVFGLSSVQVYAFRSAYSWRAEDLSRTILSTQVQCSQNSSCSTPGHPCRGELSSSSMTNCSLSDHSCCPVGEYCVNGRCQVDNSGRPCNTNDDCEGSLFGNGLMFCLNHHCVQQSNAGDVCTEDIECFGSELNQTKCVNGKCQGGRLGQLCKPPVEATSIFAITNFEGASCDFGLQCQWNGSHYVCAKVVPQGEFCNTSISCSPGTYCDLFTSTCVPYFSKKLGENCSDFFACATGFVCPNATLLKNLSIASVCVVANIIPQTPNTCESNAECPSNVACECSPFTGQSYCFGSHYPPNSVIGDPLADAFSNAITCYVKNQCTSINPNLQRGSCQHENCYGATVDLFAASPLCWLSTWFGGCMSPAVVKVCLHHTFSIYWTILLVVGALLSAVVVLIFALLMIRRRHQSASFQMIQ
jgi:hypothetical protein